ncbi:transcription termination/antitermination protein NusA [Litorivicinus lipolyticus]|uniref:Transcription termination/antitermination protein NusA n=1 Tax=Litorivicinus lipolyticus TaxID=418701 RepID=A0A5Q2Q8Q8_9GAMM|nr:transcription termination factor NusA [Litorivicinus lipolyticus]QGG79483.1 transcription termination/antitermination protein NusA [Litorivicinus lipolyticus]
MEGKELLSVVELFANEKDINKEIVFEAMEQALASATKKRFEDEEPEIHVVIDRESGDYQTFRTWLVRADDEMAILGSELTTEEANEVDPSLEVGDTHKELVANAGFGRIEAQAAKQVIVQKIREAEREKVVVEYEDRVGTLINGTVKKTTRDNVIVDLGNNAEGLLPRENLVGREIFRINDRIRALLEEVRPEGRGPQLLLTRTAPKMIMELFKLEVPEVSEEVIEIRGAARDPGSRAKIAVKTNDGRIDPVGACVGMRGSRVQAVSNELNNERVDIVLWDDNPAQLVINALSPAEVASIVMDEEAHTMDVAVAEDNLAQAIGRGGQNVRLASELTGWNINIMTLEDADARREAEMGQYVEQFMEWLGIDDELAGVLVEEGFTTLEEVVYVPREEMLAIEGFEEDLVDALRERSRDALLNLELAREEKLEGREPAEDLLTMEGMDRATAFKLAEQDIRTMEDLAEQAVDDLLDIEGIDAERAAALIMKAREPWFAE